LIKIYAENFVGATTKFDGNLPLIIENNRNENIK